MKHLFRAILLLIVLSAATALAEGTRLTTQAPNDYANALYRTLGAKGILTDELKQALIDKDCVDSDADFSRFKLVEHFMLKVETDGEEPGVIFTSLPIRTKLAYGDKIFGVICAFDGTANWMPVRIVLNTSGSLNTPFTVEEARLIYHSQATVFFLFRDPPLEESPFYKDILFAPNIPDSYYHCIDLDVNLFGANDAAKKTTAKRYVAAWDAMIEGHEDYVTRTTLGFSSDNTSVCMLYTLKSKKATEDGPKIIIVSGQHGYEKASPFGLYWFANDLINHWQEDPTLRYLHEHVTLLIMPCMNPYGFDNYVRYNANGVDLNRNYDFRFKAGREGSDGEAAFSEPETDMVRRVIEDNLDALCVLDFHNYGQGEVQRPDGRLNIVWHSYSTSVKSDAFYSLMLNATTDFIDEIIPVYEAENRLREGSTYGRYTTVTRSSILKDWALSKGVLAITFEMPNGFPRPSEYIASERVQRLNAEGIGNYLRILLKTYAEWGRTAE